jgi:hypothetical protein
MKMLAPAVMGLILWMHPFLAAAASPAEEMRASIDKVLATLKDARLQKNPEKRREAIKEIIRERFDFGEMARRSLVPSGDAALPKNEENSSTCLSICWSEPISRRSRMSSRYVIYAKQWTETTQKSEPEWSIRKEWSFPSITGCITLTASGEFTMCLSRT